MVCTGLWWVTIVLPQVGSWLSFAILKPVLTGVDLSGNWMRARACSCVFCPNQHLWRISPVGKAMLRALMWTWFSCVITRSEMVGVLVLQTEPAADFSQVFGGVVFYEVGFYPFFPHLIVLSLFH